jgi:heme exporter protein CcmD
MYWKSLNDFLQMGGHAGFVWPAVAVVFLGLAGLVLQSLRAASQAERDLAAARREAGRD